MDSMLRRFSRWELIMWSLRSGLQMECMWFVLFFEFILANLILENKLWISSWVSLSSLKHTWSCSSKDFCNIKNSSIKRVEKIETIYHCCIKDCIKEIILFCFLHEYLHEIEFSPNFVSLVFDFFSFDLAQK